MKIIVCSIPKSGTYLLAEVLQRLGLVRSGLHLAGGVVSDYHDADMTTARVRPQRYRTRLSYRRAVARVPDNGFVVAHIAAAEVDQLAGLTPLFLHRNLRDVVVSYCRWTLSSGRWQERGEGDWRLRPEPARQLLGFFEAHGDRVIQSILDAADWLDRAGTPRITFEDLLGDRGPEGQLHSLRTVAAAVQQHRPDDALTAIITAALAAPTITRSAGRTDWRGYWSPAFEDQFERSGLRALNRRLGHEGEDCDAERR